MNWEDYFGFYPTAPALVPASVARSADSSPISVAFDASAGPQKLSFSSDFAIVGWLAFGIFALAAYRIAIDYLSD